MDNCRVYWLLEALKIVKDNEITVIVCHHILRFKFYWEWRAFIKAKQGLKNIKKLIEFKVYCNLGINFRWSD